MRQKIRSLIGLGFVCVSPLVSAGHYVPEVCFHDTAQRLFPVEAARVLAWCVNRQAPGKVAEVKWETVEKVNGPSDWKVTWLDDEGAEIASGALHYELEDLHSGAGYYRSVWKALTAPLAKLLPASAAVSPTVQRGVTFWSAYNDGQQDRMTLATDMLPWLEKANPASDAPTAEFLAARLLRADTAVLTTTTTLDYLCLSRAAAWLCRSEELSGSQLPENVWSVLHYLAGREIPASNAWKAAPGTPLPENAMWVAWNGVMKAYPASDKVLALAAVDHPSPLYLPLLLARSRYFGAAVHPLDDVLLQLYSPAEIGAPDYGPVLTEGFLMSSLRGIGMMAPLNGQKSCLKAIAAFPAKTDEITAKVHEAIEVLAKSGSRYADPLATGTYEIGKVIELGAAAHQGRLGPVAMVTREELLVHLWESSLLCWQNLYTFATVQLGLPEMADKMAQTVAESAPSLAFAMQRLERKSLPPGSTQTSWLEFLDQQQLGWVRMFEKPRLMPTNEDPSAAISFLRNPWRRGMLAYDQWRTLYPSRTSLFSNFNSMKIALEQSNESCISQGCSAIHRGMPTRDIQDFLSRGSPYFKLSREACPNATSLQRQIDALPLFGGRGGSLSPLERAQKVEESFWAAPAPDAALEVMRSYLAANALASVKRFYSQCIVARLSSVGFSNFGPPMRWTLAWLEKDSVAMKAAAADAPSFSARDLEKQALQEFVAGHQEELSKLGAAYSGRYDALGSPPWLAAMMPLREALKNPASSQHAEAVAHFHTMDRNPAVQFILLTQFDISADDCIKIFARDPSSAPPTTQSGSPSDPTPPLFLAWWRKDAVAFAAAWPDAKYRPSTGVLAVLLQYFKSKLEGAGEPTGQSDLKPAQDSRLEVIVREAMIKAGKKPGGSMAAETPPASRAPSPGTERR
ncbi:MAG: hypothetical protein H7A55_23245 [Verrucomicrobiaceae bacterium]|nr:hypothetical protein [Verrucomicrobiaceae bacterium]